MRYASTWVNLKNILYERCETEKSKQCDILFKRTIRNL